MNNIEFDNYVKQFDLNDPMINRKYYHTYRVVDYCEKIAKNINLDKHDIFIAKMTGLLHDIARFEQARDYKTFNDKKSFDHGDRGVEILKENNFIHNFVENEDDIKIIYKAIKLHNKKYLEDNLSKKEELFCKIIRDADKLDIMDKCCNTLNDNSTTFNKEAYNEICNNKLITYSNVDNDCTNILKTIAYIFDINFNESIKIIVDKELIKKKLDILRGNVDKTQLEKVEKLVNQYINDRLL